jgi:excisionase family DNA binding protein
MEPEEILRRLKEINQLLEPGQAKTMLEGLALDLFLEYFGSSEDEYLIEVGNPNPIKVVSEQDLSWRPPDTEDLLSARQIAEKLGFNRRTVVKWMADGKLPAQQIGAAWFTTPEELQQFMASGYLDKAYSFREAGKFIHERRKQTE